MFQKSEFGLATGGAPASAWLAGAVAQPRKPAAAAHDWASRFRDWSDDVDLIPDLGRNIGSLTWLRGVATLLALLAGAYALTPGFEPLPGRAGPLLAPRQYEEVRSQMITPLAFGADSGRHMGPTDAVVPLTSTPERPQIELSAAIGEGDGFARSLARAGVSDHDAMTVQGLLGASVDTSSLSAGTRLDIVLGRRTSRSVPRPLDRLGFRARLDLAIEIERVAGSLVLTRVPIAVDATPLRIRGRVGSSLYRSARAAGVPGSAIQAYLQLVSSHTDLDGIGADDTFDIVVGYRRAATGEAEVGDLIYGGLDRARGKDLQLLKWTSGGRSEWYEASGVGESRGQLARPVAGRLSSGYGSRRHPILGYTRMHAGVDFAAPYGSPIYAVTDGTVGYAGWHGGHGRYVRLEHGGGLGSGYGHMSRIAVAPGSRVRRGQVIGYVGSTGLSTGPHLHYEVYRRGATVNPMSITFTTTAQLAGADLNAFKARLEQVKALKAGIPAPMTVQTGPAPGGSPAAGGNGEVALLPNGKKKLL